MRIDQTKEQREFNEFINLFPYCDRVFLDEICNRWIVDIGKVETILTTKRIPLYIGNHERVDVVIGGDMRGIGCNIRGKFFNSIPAGAYFHIRDIKKFEDKHPEIVNRKYVDDYRDRNERQFFS